MNFMENIGKKIRNKKTGKIMVVHSVGEGIHITLIEENKRENWIGFLVGSPVGEEWEIYEEIEETKKEKDTWNLADTYEAGCIPKFFEPKDIKTFIQKVKEDIMDYNVSVDGKLNLGELIKIIDKRAGDLNG